ncbi:hypothetical protein ACWDBW_45065 [Streptomyces sp. NPDC001107]
METHLVETEHAGMNAIADVAASGALRAHIASPTPPRWPRRGRRGKAGG